ncbi:MAG: helix-turn-helix transcriptional regulator [Chitinophagales bacterium]|nr:helix-turn-helix transcriptional regulator [Chitinophagales bacterium]
MGAVKNQPDQQKLDYASDVMRAIAHPLRLKIIEFIDKNKKINVNKIYNTLRLEQSITSQHLRIMRDAGVVLADRNGKFIYYSLDYKKLKHINRCISRFFDRSKSKS